MNIGNLSPKELYNSFDSKDDALKHYKRIYKKGEISKNEYKEICAFIKSTDSLKYKSGSKKINPFSIIGPLSAIVIIATILIVAIPKIKDSKNSSNNTGDTGSSVVPSKEQVNLSNLSYSIKKDGDEVSQLTCFEIYNFHFAITIENVNSDVFENSITFTMHSISVDKNGEYKGIEFSDFTSVNTNEITATTYIVEAAMETKDLEYLIPFKAVAESNVRITVAVNEDVIINETLKASL